MFFHFSLVRSLLSLVLLVAACSHTEVVPYGPDQCLALFEDETLVDNSQDLIDDYDPFHGVRDFQVPIHKCIEADGYQAYFGIGVGFDSDESLLFEAYQGDDSYDIIDSRKVEDRSTGLTSFQIFCKKGNLFNHKYIFTIPEPLMTLVVNEVSPDSSSIARLYHDQEYVSRRRRCK